MKTRMNKISRAVIAGVILLVGLTGPATAQKKIKITFPTVDWTTGWAAGLKVGTLGPGIEGIKSINKNWNARLGFSYLPFNTSKQFAVSNLNLDLQAKTRIGGVNLQGDFFIRPWFYFTGGVLVNLTSSTVSVSLTQQLDYGDIIISPADIGTLSVRVRPGLPVSPFLGIGLGNPLPIGKRFSFNMELGAMYHGKPHFRLEAVGMINPTAGTENEIALETAFKGYRFYPLLSAQVNYRIR